MSYNSALASFAKDGWAVASEQQVRELLNALTGFTSYSSWTNNYDWLNVLHSTIGVTYEYPTTDPVMAWANFLYGDPYDYSGFSGGKAVHVAQIFDWQDPSTSSYREISALNWDYTDPNRSDMLRATMFVRPFQNNVPSPTTISLFFIGLLILSNTRKRMSLDSKYTVVL